MAAAAKKPEVRVLCWTSSTGRKPVREWIAGLDDAALRRVDKLIGLVRALGQELRPPHCRFLGDGLYELRDTATGPGLRLYYAWEGETLVILLAAGDKGSQTQDIATARRRQKRDEE